MSRAKRLKRATIATARIVSFEDWLRSVRLSRSTGYRLRRRGAIETVNIFGRHYVTVAEVRRFERRALAGEFAKVLSPASFSQK